MKEIRLFIVLNRSSLFLVLGLRNYDDGDDIAEIDGGEPAGLAQPQPPMKIPKMISRNEDDAKPSIVSFKQPPVITSVFADPETKQAKCLVVITLFANVKTIDFDIDETENGQVLRVTYPWPDSSYKASEMFKRDANEETFIGKMHPKFLATEKALMAVREHIDDAPVGTIEVKLPIKVQREPNTWKKEFNKKKDGTLLVFLEFESHRESSIISKDEKSLSFE